jgi:hypothetical protein
MNPTGEFRNSPSVAFSDDKVSAIWESQANGGLCLNLYDTRTLEVIQQTEQVSEAMGCRWNEYLVSDSYIINVSDTGIVYYRKGTNSIQIIAGSSLGHMREGGVGQETYYKYEDGPDQRPDFSFDESTNTLTVSIFRKTEEIDGVHINTKLRTTNFIVPQ